MDSLREDMRNAVTLCMTESVTGSYRVVWPGRVVDMLFRVVWSR